MNWTWPVTPKGLVGACDSGKIIRVPLGSWSEPWKGAEQWYSIMEQQLYAVCDVLQQVEDVTKGLPKSSSNAKNHHWESRTAVPNIKDPHGH